MIESMKTITTTITAMYHLMFPAKILQYRYFMIFEHCLSFCPYSWDCYIVCFSVLILGTVILFVFLRITDSDHPFGIFIVKHMLTVYFWNYRSIITDLPQLSLYPNSNDFVIDISVRSLLSLRGC